MQTLHDATIVHEKGHYAIDKAHYESPGVGTSLEASVVYDPTTSLPQADMDQHFFGSAMQQRDVLQGQHDTNDVFMIPCQFHFI